MSGLIEINGQKIEVFSQSLLCLSVCKNYKCN